MPASKLAKARATFKSFPDLCLEPGKHLDGVNGTIVERILQNAITKPFAPCLRGPVSKIDGTFKELCYYDFVENAKKIAANILQQLQITNGDTSTLRDRFIAIYLKRDMTYVLTQFAVLLCGAAYLPLSDKLPDERLAYILSDAKPLLIVTTDDIKMSATLAVAQDMNDLSNYVVPFHIEEILDLQIETTLPPHTRRLPKQSKKKSIEKQYSHQIAGPKNLAYMIYTSGTTGNPKGVEIEHHSLLNVLMSHVKSGMVNMADLEYSVVVAAFIFDSHVREVWLPLLYGGCLCIAEDVLHLAEGTKCAGTPSGLQAAAAARSLPSTLRTVMAGGERLTGKICKDISWPNTEVTKIINAYGPTETVVESLVWQADLSDGCNNIPESGVPIGLPVMNGVAYGLKLDKEGDRDEDVIKLLLNGTATPQTCLARRGEPCELYMGGEAVARGYHDRPDLNATKFIPNPFEGEGRMYATGDLVIFPAKQGGPLQFIGRVDTQVKIRGKRLELGEVESYLNNFPAVNDCKVLLKTSKEGTAHLATYVLWEDSALKEKSAAIWAKELLEYARLTMEDYKRPEFVVSFPLEIEGQNYDIFPLTIGGKVNTKILPDPWDVKQPAEEKSLEVRRSVKRSTMGLSWNNPLSPDAMEVMEDYVGTIAGAGRNSFIPGRVSTRKSRGTGGPGGSGTRMTAMGIRASKRGTAGARATILDLMKGAEGGDDKTGYVMKELYAKQTRSSVLLDGIVPGVKVNDAPVKEDLTKNAATDQAFDAIMNVVKDLLTGTLGDEVHKVTADDDFFALGLNSLHVPRLKYEVKLQLNKDISTDAIFLNPTVNRLALFLSKPPEESGADLEIDELMDISMVKDKPLPKPVVWFLTLFGAYIMHGLSICLMTFCALLQFVYVHEASKCSERGVIGQVDSALQTHCKDPNLWNAFLAIIAAFPLIMISCITVMMIWTVLMKRIIIGTYQPGIYAIDGPYYFRWLYVHYMEAFARMWLLGRLPFRSSKPFIWYARAMGAKIGNHVELDTLDVHDMCMITIEDGVCVQNDAMLSGHCFASVRDTKIDPSTSKEKADTRPVLVIGRVWLKKDAVVGPYAMVQPRMPRPHHNIDDEILLKAATVVEGVLPAMQATSRLGQTIQLPNQMMAREKDEKGRYLRPANENTVWTPPVPGWFQVVGYIVMILFQWAASIPTIAIMYAWLVPAEPTMLIWFYRLWVLHTPFIMGIPYCIYVLILKWVFIGKFKDGQKSTPYLDNMRWLLHTLLQNGTLRVFELGSCSSEILNQFYRMMGVKIGWNAQVMPLNLVEFDLFEIGDCVAFGGQVMIAARDANGVMRKIRIGHDSAITNSSIMLSGSSIGDSCLVGNLTCLPPGHAVPDVSKCVGTKYIGGSHQPPVTFANTVEKRGPAWKSNITMVGHAIFAIGWDLIEMPGMVLLSWFLSEVQKLAPDIQYEYHLIFSPWGLPGAYLMENCIIAILGTCTTLCCIVVKRLTWGFLGDYTRDAPIFVLFIYLTKLQMNQQMWNQVMNGTPWQSLVYKNWGADIASSARLFMRFFADITGLSIGEDSVLDYDCYLEQHQKTSTLIEFHPLKIGDRCVLGQRSMLLHSSELGDGSWVYPLSAVPPNEPIDPEELVGGVLATSYYKQTPEAILMTATKTLRARTDKQSQPGKETVDIVIVGAGAGGLVAAYEFINQGLNVRIIEKTDKIMGCWATGANATSHVAVSEATYRFPGIENKSDVGDYPPRYKVLENGHRFFEQFNLDRITEFNAEVTNIDDFPGKDIKIASGPGDNSIFKYQHGRCEVTYNVGGKKKVLGCSGVFVATGAQCEQNHHIFPGEATIFKGEAAYGSANDIGDILKNVKGKNVVIVGGGAFAVENVRTFLMHGAKHVTIVHRSTLQVWPRSVNYLMATEKDRPFKEYAEAVQKAAEWAGYTIGENDHCQLAPLMHPSTKAQPTASDVFFAFGKLGLVTLVRGEIQEMKEKSALIKKKTGGTAEIKCDVLLKCIGWKEPGRMFKKFFPNFTHRNFVFLNSSPRIMFVCDPHYSYGTKLDESEVAEQYAALLETVPPGATNSVLLFSRYMAWLHMYSLGNDVTRFNKMLVTLPPSSHPTCTWNEMKFSFPTNKELSDMIQYKMGIHKDMVAAKHPTVWDFFKMSSAYLKRDMTSYVATTGDQKGEGIEKEFKNALCEAAVLQDLMSIKMVGDDDEETVPDGY